MRTPKRAQLARVNRVRTLEPKACETVTLKALQQQQVMLRHNGEFYVKCAMIVHC